MKCFPHRRPGAAAVLLVIAGLCRAAGAQRPTAVNVLQTPEGRTETGLLEGTPYRIDVPDEWNGSLVVYYHGYQELPASFHRAERLDKQMLPMFQRHYAVLQSAYSRTGWALPQAYPETELLRRYFARAYRQPRETYAVGGSMGGALVMITLELNPKPYLGGLDLCGSVVPAIEAFNRRFAWRAAFDYYFPGLMPPLVPVPASYEENAELKAKIRAALTANPAAAAAMRNLTGLHADGDVANIISYSTFVVGDLQQRAHGNPFDNRNYIYAGTSPTSSATDWALNDGVKRYAADPRALPYLVQHYTPSGRLQRPMLALHTVYDPLIPATTLEAYGHIVESAGFARNLVQQYVHRDGHCTFSADEIGRAFDELVTWTHTGPRPQPGLLKVPEHVIAQVH